AISNCDVFLAVIGSKWTGQSRGRRRIDDPQDLVRVEIETALARGIVVIPVLIKRMKMPASAHLPQSLQGLRRLNGVTIDEGRDFNVHVDRLIRQIEAVVNGVPSQTEVASNSDNKAADGRATAPSTATQFRNKLGMSFTRIERSEFDFGSSPHALDQLMRTF